MSTSEKIFDIKRILLGGVVAFVGTGIIVSLTNMLGTNLGAEFVERFGLLGIYLGLLFIDTIPTPGGALPILTLGLQGGVPLFIIGCLSVLASYSAGIAGFLLGKNVPFPQRWKEKLSNRFPNLFTNIQTHEYKGFLLLVALPIPMSLAAWLGANVSYSFRTFCIAGLLRIPKITIYLLATFSSVRLF